MSEDSMKADNQWHLSKSVNISLIFSILLSWGGALYFFGELSETVTTNSKNIVLLNKDVRELQLIINKQNVTLGRIDQTLNQLDRTLARLERNIDDNRKDITR